MLPLPGSPLRRRRLVAAVLLTSALTSGGLLSATPATATTIGQQAVHEASRHQGQPYVYGAAGPTRFDCSGFTLYVWGRLGKRLPHSSAQQYTSSAVRHISKSSRAVGDLLFMKNSSGRITHVGIYAGSNRWWVAPKSGDHVKLQTLYSSNYVVARLR
jgi:cell wall-associated NlpC family hydrolase